jgi:hypothetical protein
MAAYLQLSADTDLTLGDIEAWAARARALGATAASPVDYGDDQPLPADGKHALMLSVPVVVTRTILPGDAPDRRHEPEPDDEPEPHRDAGRRDSSPPQDSGLGVQRDQEPEPGDESGPRDEPESHLAGQRNGRGQGNGPEPDPAAFSNSA